MNDSEHDSQELYRHHHTHPAGRRGPLREYIGLFVFDALAWTVALCVALIFRLDFSVEAERWGFLSIVVFIAVFTQLGLGWTSYLYRGRHSFGSFDEVRALGSVGGLVGIVVIVVPFLQTSSMSVPRSVGFIAVPTAIVLMFSARYLLRLVTDSRQTPDEDAVPALIYGAGYVGTVLVRRLSTDPYGGYRAVGLIDDDPDKRYVQRHRVKVLGRIDDLPGIVEDTGAKVLVVAIANPPVELLRTVQTVTQPLDVKVKVMPPLPVILDHGARATDLRDLQIEDLLGRPPINTGVDSMASYLANKRVLVTGAGGSIGSELCLQIAGFGVSELIMLDRDETALQEAQLTISGHGLLNSRDVVLADIRDADTLNAIFEERKPEVVFHAAALKHLPMLEQYPDEAWKTNVLGTLNVLEASRASEVSTFVNVSTDKAANPTSALGHSKRCAEKLTAWMGHATGSSYISVRFGNVIGSRGSMLPTFTTLIERGGPLTVTHPDATRYFMTIPEACQLVIQAGGVGSTGEVLILDMGSPVRILDIAKRMIGMSGKDVKIIFTGLRDGEKLHEELVGTNERVFRPFHPKISHASVKSLTPDRLDHATWRERMVDQSVALTQQASGMSAQTSQDD